MARDFQEMKQRRKITALEGPGFAVKDYDGEVRPGRWATEEDAIEHGLAGMYLLSGAEVVEVQS